MAKKAKVNKSQMIREAVAAHKGKTPTEIAEMLKGQGLKVSGQYVSTIKSNWKKKRRGKHRGGRKGMNHLVGHGMTGVPAALEFIKAAGSLEQAKAALGTVEEIGKAVS